MTTLTEAITREMQHPACTMDDPLTAALAQVQDEAAAREAGACTEIPELEYLRAVRAEAEEAVALPRWFWWAVPLALVGIAVYGFIEMSGVLK